MNNHAVTIKKRSRAKVIFFAGLLAGTLDLTTAMIVYNVKPAGMFTHIASGAVGRETAANGETGILLLGILIHYFIAFSWTILFFMVYEKMRIQKIHWTVAGLLYGAVIWTVMNLLVLPFLSAIPAREFQLAGVLTGMTILMTMIGLPVSLMANRYFRSMQ
jgi:hypothetical protein